MMHLLLLSSAMASIPDDHSVGFGIGIAAPTGSFAPNTVSVRVKAMENLVVEPSLDSSFGATGTKNDVGGTEFQSRTTNFTFGAGLGLRYHVASRDPVALVFSVTPFAQLDQVLQDPDVDADDDVTTTTNVSAGAGWGLGTSFHPGGPWQISADVSNPLVVFGRTGVRQPNDDLQSSSSVDFGLIFAPTVRMMAHLWF